MMETQMQNAVAAGGVSVDPATGRVTFTTGGLDSVPDFNPRDGEEINTAKLQAWVDGLGFTEEDKARVFPVLRKHFASELTVEGRMAWAEHMADACHLSGKVREAALAVLFDPKCMDGSVFDNFEVCFGPVEKALILEGRPDKLAMALAVLGKA